MPGPTTDRLPEYLAATARAISALSGRFVVTLGGEHLLTYGVVTGLVVDPAEVTIVQIDAHADLADKLGRSNGTLVARHGHAAALGPRLPPRADRHPQPFPRRT